EEAADRDGGARVEHDAGRGEPNEHDRPRVEPVGCVGSAAEREGGDKCRECGGEQQGWAEDSQGAGHGIQPMPAVKRDGTRRLSAPRPSRDLCYSLAAALSLLPALSFAP